MPLFRIDGQVFIKIATVNSLQSKQIARILRIKTTQCHLNCNFHPNESQSEKIKEKTKSNYLIGNFF